MTSFKEQEGYTSKYSIIETEDGFRVEGRDRHPVHVRLAPSKTAILVGFDESVAGISTCVNLYAYHALLDAIANVAMSNWQRPQNAPSHWGGIKPWAIGRTKLALSSRAYAQWQRLLALVPETKRLVCKAIFAATFSSEVQGCEAWDELYEHPYLIKDILNYRAAAIACNSAYSLIQDVGIHLYSHYVDKPTALMSYEQRQLLDFYTKHFAFSGPKGISEPFDQADPICRKEMVSILAQDWKVLFSRTATPGKSLRRTLMNLPGGISAQMLCQFPSAEPFLMRPITDRVELLTLLSFSSSHALWAYRTNSYPWESGFYAKARRSEILSALGLLSKHLRRKLVAKSADIAELVNFIRDYCRWIEQEELPRHPKQGNIVGLIEKAIVFHREQRQRTIEHQLAAYAGREDTPTALPPIPLPVNSAITFLATVGNVVREGAEMAHCLASYAEAAVAGRCYLFHVEYKGTTASTQLDAQGNCIQSYGPFNSTNAAALYGKRVLARWGKQLQQATPPAVTIPTNDEGVDLFDDQPF